MPSGYPPPPGSYGVGWNPGSAPSIGIPGIAPPPPSGSYGVGWNPGSAPSIMIPGIAPPPYPYVGVPGLPVGGGTISFILLSLLLVRSRLTYYYELKFQLP